MITTYTFCYVSHRRLSADTLRSLHALYAHEREHGRVDDESTTPPDLRAMITREREVGDDTWRLLPDYCLITA